MQARKKLAENLDDELARRILTISGRAEEWISKIEREVVQSPHLSAIEVVEFSGMGREILKIIPKEEWVYLVNPSLAPWKAGVVTEGIVKDGDIISRPLREWFLQIEEGRSLILGEKAFTEEESRIVRALWKEREEIVERDEVAQAIWGENWTEKYSDWGIDAAICRVRKKLTGNFQIVTIKGRGYILASKIAPSRAVRRALGRENPVAKIPKSIYPSDEYLSYMNDKSKLRKVYRDLFQALRKEGIELKLPEGVAVLAINSYSYDNVDEITEYLRGVKNKHVYFAHYDKRASDMHEERMSELGVLHEQEVVHDDIRESRLESGSMELVINDFRLNFNQDDAQNMAAVDNMYRILKKGGKALISTVVDGRYENVRYGEDQEKAPINALRPGSFQADEHLTRKCWSVPYYRQLFERAGFINVIEFDIEEGKRWGSKSQEDPWNGPYYRRWLLEKW